MKSLKVIDKQEGERALAHHNIVFSRSLKVVSRHEFETQQHHTGHSFRKASGWSQFVTMAMVQLAGPSSLRDIIESISAQACRLYHLGRVKLARFNLSRIDDAKPYELYEAMFRKLLRCCLTVLPGHDFRTTKGTVKRYVVLYRSSRLLEFVSVTESKLHDVTVGRTLKFPKGSVVVVDKGYNDYIWYTQLTDKGIFFADRLKSNAKYHTLGCRSVLKSKGLTSGRTIEFVGIQTARKFPVILRRIGNRDAESSDNNIDAGILYSS